MPGHSRFGMTFGYVTLSGQKCGFDKTGQPVATVTLVFPANGDQIGRLIDMATLGHLEVTFAPELRHLDALDDDEDETEGVPVFPIPPHKQPVTTGQEDEE